MVVHFHEWKYNLQYLEENGYKGTSFITLMVIYSSLTLSFNHHNYDESAIKYLRYVANWLLLLFICADSQRGCFRGASRYTSGRCESKMEWQVLKICHSYSNNVGISIKCWFINWYCTPAPLHWLKWFVALAYYCIGVRVRPGWANKFDIEFMKYYPKHLLLTLSSCSAPKRGDVVSCKWLVLYQRWKR